MAPELQGRTGQILVRWQLQLKIDGVEVERHKFSGDEAGYRDAHRAASVWMTGHGVNSSSQWIFSSAQNLQRMTWDEDYRREIGKRIS